MIKPVWIKRFVAILALSIVGYFLLLHAGMSSDSAPELAWYYRLEMLVAGLFWWPASLYLGLRKLIDPSYGMLGFELWLFQFLGYFTLFKLYDKYKN